MLAIKEAIIVEGKYDKIRLETICNAIIIETGGYALLKNKEKLEYIEMLAEKTGIIILTDSDSAGLRIRNYLTSVIDLKYIKHAYIPDVFGCEKRKSKSGKEGKLGVEGIDNNTLIAVLKTAHADFYEKENIINFTLSDLYEADIYGKSHSLEKRKNLLKKLNLPSNLSVNRLLKYLNEFYQKNEFFDLIKK